MKSSIILAICAASISSTQVSAQLSKVDRYLWSPSDSETEWGRKRTVRGARRRMAKSEKAPASDVVSFMSLSMSMPDIEELEFDFESSMSMSMSIP